VNLPQLNIQGEGQPLIWLHGMLNSVESDAVYSLIDLKKISSVVSLIRYDAGNKSATSDYSWISLTDELFRVADRENIDSMVLAGCSMGSGTAIHAAIRFPERVKALILVTPPPAWEKRAKVKDLYMKVASKAKPNSIPEFLKRIIQMNQDPPDFFEENHPRTRQLLLKYRLSFEPQYYSNIYIGGAASDLPSREQIAKINVPTLIVSLPDDVNHPLEMAKELNYLINDSELFVVSDYNDYLKLQKRVHDFLIHHGIDNKS